MVLAAADVVVVHGGYLHTPSRGSWECVQEALVHVDAAGVISRIDDRRKLADEVFTAAVAAARSGSTRYYALPPGSFLLPGFVDCHVHAPQYAAAGTGLDLPLMEWLERYTFPSEAKMVDPAAAHKMYEAVVRATLRSGTTTACYFGTIHAAATLVLAERAKAAGQRAMVGLVSMDRNGGGTELTADGCIAELETVLEAFSSGPLQRFPPHGLVQPIVTPRFVPTCSTQLLRRLGAIAAERGGLRIQSHCAESHDCVALCRALHPHEHSGREAALLDAAGLLTQQALMAHCVHLSANEVALFSERGTSVAHCPISNAYFAHGVLPVRKLWEAGVTVGLGTDVAGGFSPSILSAVRAAVMVSHMLQDGVDHIDDRGSCGGSSSGDGIMPPSSDGAAISLKEALWLATVGGATALGLQKQIGLIAVGMSFDALAVDPRRARVGSSLNVDVGGVDSFEETVEKYLLV